MTICLFRIILTQRKKNLIAFEKSTRRRPDEERATRGSNLPKRTGHHVLRHFQWFLHNCHSSRIFSPSDRSRSAHSWSACVCRWGTERLRVSGHLESRSAKTLSLLTRSQDPLSVFTARSCGSSLEVPGKVSCRGGKKPTPRTRRTEGASRLFLVRVSGRCQCKCQGNVPSQAGKPSTFVAKRNSNT